jgi:hypothetical protein
MKNQTLEKLKKAEIAYSIQGNYAYVLLEDETPYHGKILYTSKDRTNELWKVEYRKHKKRYFTNKKSGYITTYKTRQEAINHIIEAEK